MKCSQRYHHLSDKLLHCLEWFRLGTQYQKSAISTDLLIEWQFGKYLLIYPKTNSGVAQCRCTIAHFEVTQLRRNWFFSSILFLPLLILLTALCTVKCIQYCFSQLHTVHSVQKVLELVLFVNIVSPTAHTVHSRIHTVHTVQSVFNIVSLKYTLYTVHSVQSVPSVPSVHIVQSVPSVHTVHTLHVVFSAKHSPFSVICSVSSSLQYPVKTSFELSRLQSILSQFRPPSLRKVGSSPRNSPFLSHMTL